jgi:starch synthase
MRVALLTREYPPEVYGGAGVHVAYLARELARLTDLEIHCFGGDRAAERDRKVVAYEPWSALAGPDPHLGALRAVSVDLTMAASVGDVDVVHSHTWYANFAGHLAKLLYGVPHVATVHSLEPLRPWKASQLGAGYGISCFCERVALESADAVIAVSKAMARDVRRCYPSVDPERIVVVPNGIDPDEFAPDSGTDVLNRYGIDPELPIVACVARITAQKGLGHLLDAALEFDRPVQLVLRAGPADTTAEARVLRARIDEVAGEGHRVVWIEDPLDRREMAQLLSHATVACCPSVYEPFGLVNIEAMACQTPVVASAVGGIPEVVDHGVTGLLVPFEPRSARASQPARPEQYARDLASAVNALVGDRDLARVMGEAGRHRVLDDFTYSAMARHVVAVYEAVATANANAHSSGADVPPTSERTRARRRTGAGRRTHVQPARR